MWHMSVEQSSTTARPLHVTERRADDTEGWCSRPTAREN